MVVAAWVTLLTVKAVVVPTVPTVPVTVSVGVMRNSTSEFVPVTSLPLAHTNVYDVPAGLEVRPVKAFPPVPAVAVFHVVPPSGLYSATMLHASEDASMSV